MSVEKLTEKMAAAEALRLRLQALERGLTARVRARLLEFAKRRVRMLQALGVRCAADDAAAYVHDAIADTMIGDATWTEGVPVAVHLHGLIRSRTTAAAERQRRTPHDSIPDHDDGGALGVVAGPEVRYEAREVLGRVMAWLETAGANAEVMQLVAAYRRGARTRAQVADATGMTVDEVTAARRRLDRLVAAMPGDEQRDELSRSGTW